MDYEKVALRYSAKGWFTFPCKSRDKVPLTEHGCTDATLDPEQIASWAQKFPGANIAVATGPSRLFVLDVDTKSGGMESLEEMCMFFPEIRETWTVTTGTGGLHFYFSLPEGVECPSSAGKLGPGLDVRARGGYVVAPLSVHPNGEKYKWTQHDGELREVPPGLLERLSQESSKFSESQQNLTADPIPDGQRNATLTSIAGKMRRIGCDAEMILAGLHVQNNARCNPPLEEAELSRIAKSVCRYEPSEVIDRLSGRTNSENGTREGKKRLELITYNTVKKESIDWLWEGRIAYGKISLLIGLPGKTKSYLTCSIAAHASCGLPLPDDNSNLNPEPISVLLVTYEDGQGDTIAPRLSKCGADMSRIYTLPLTVDSFSIEDVPALEQTLIDNPDIRLVIIDPMQNMMGGTDDNSDAKVRQALNPLVVLAARMKIAVLGVKHLNKNESASIDNRIGGSIGYAGLARTILLAGHDNEKPFGPNGEVYAGVTRTKGNISGYCSPIAYEVNDFGLIYHGKDADLVPERLLPKPPDRKRKPDG